MVKTYVKRSNANWLQKLIGRYDQSAELAIGWPIGPATSIRYPDGTSVLLVAAVNHFGSPSRGIPSRPFMTAAAPEAVARTSPIAARLVKYINSGKATKAQVLGDMGPFAVGAFQDTIANGRQFVANSPITVALKESDNPLNDTGLMRQSITFAVREP